MRTNNTRKGFTTVELVIVIAVIAILATVLIPTFSNMINQANLSVDKQNVRNMNMVLLTYMLDETDEFCTVKHRLEEGGYGKDENFLPKTNGYKYFWYVDEADRNNDGKVEKISVILLVDQNKKVVYPEDYADVNVMTLENPYKCFDLSLPAAEILKDTQKEPISGKDLSGNPVADLSLAMSYTFEADPEASANYSDWYADFIISVDKDIAEVTVAGWYQAVEDYFGGWLVVSGPMSVDTPMGVIAIADEGTNWTYSDIQQFVGVFKCGIYDEPGGEDANANMRIELRLTNPENPEDIRVIGVITYTFQ